MEHPLNGQDVNTCCVRLAPHPISNERYKAVVDTQMEMICRFLPDTTLTFVNTAYCQYFSKTAKELIGTSFLTLISEKRRDCVRQFLDESAMLTPEHPSVVHEHEVTHPDGTMGWQQWQDIAIFDAEGRIVEYQSLGRDITQRKQVECALERSQQQYQALIHSVDSVVWEADCETFAFTFVSPQAEKLLGYPPDAWLSDPAFWMNHIYPDDREQAVNTCVTQSKHGNNHTFDYRMVRSDGDIVWVRDIVNVTMENGKPVTLQGILIDITEEKLKEEQLRQYQRVVSATPDAIAIIDSNYRYVLVNQAYLSWHGLQEHQAVGHAVCEVFDPELFQHTLKPHLDEALAGNISQFQHWIEFRAVGQQFVSVTYAPYFDTRGTVAGVAELARDITGLKHVETSLHQQAEQERVLAGITNRIRQTLNLQSILDITVAEVRAYLSTDRVLIYEFAEDLAGAVIAESLGEGYPSTWGRVFTNHGFTPEKCLIPYTQGHIHCLSDVYNADLPECYVEMLEQYHVRANLAVPILQGQKVWGLLAAHDCGGSREWTPDEIEFLKRLTDQLAIAIQQAQLYEQVHGLNLNLESQVRDRTTKLEQSLEFESLLKRITDNVRDSLDETQILQTAVEELALGLSLDCCDTALFNTEKTGATITCEFIQGWQTAIGQFFTFADFLHPGTIEKQDAQFCVIRELYRELPYRPTVLSVPIFHDQEVLGDIWLFRPAEQVFLEPEVRLVKQVANQCAIAIRQARLFKASQVQVKELERLNALKDDFLSTVSHELRTPMANIKMALQMFEIYLDRANLLEDETLPLGKYFQVLKQECDRETTLINDLLDLTRLDDKDQPLIKCSIQLDIWAAHITEVFSEQAHKNQQFLAVSIPSNITVYTDLSYLERILTELLNNAIKYTPSGENITVSSYIRQCTESEPRGDASECIRLVVSNSGVELPPEECDRMFEKFYRIPNHDPWKYRGMGLGLALVKKLAASIDATIWAESSHNEVRLILDLPCAQPAT
ncbi:MAG: PAS domain S-box protein [Leptolyngbyaceae bacterium]|nr:PAS domain S-box protein [Leptolyngbyaceae bacterium]